MNMSTSDDGIMSRCAGCGKGDGDGDSCIKLKTCTACKAVKYCSVDCQKAHRPKHKRECKKRAAELHDEELFKVPPKRTCPICEYYDPNFGNRVSDFNDCCGNYACAECTADAVIAAGDETIDLEQIMQSATLLKAARCPFCRAPIASDSALRVKRENERMELNDDMAYYIRGLDYYNGTEGFAVDKKKGIELWLQAIKLNPSSGLANFGMGSAYQNGDGVEQDEKKAKFYYERSAIGGFSAARIDLVLIEGKSGNTKRMMKHQIILAMGGDGDFLDIVKNGYISGDVTKDDFEKTLRAHKESVDAMKPNSMLRMKGA